MITDEMIARAAFEVEQSILASLPDPSECDHVFSKSFEKKMKKLIRRTKYGGAYEFMRRAACFFIAVLLSICTFLAFNTNARAAFVDWVKEQFEDVYHYFFIGESMADKEKIYYLGWLPDGYVELDCLQEKNGEIIAYVNESGKIIRFTYMYGSETQALFIGDNYSEIKSVNIDGWKADIYLASEEEKASAITWENPDDNVLFSVSACLSEEDLIKIAQNISVKEKN